MKYKLLLVLVVSAWVACAARGQIVITSFNQNGLLVCSNLGPGSMVGVAWAPSLSGPWQTNLAGLEGISVGANGIVQFSVPISKVGNAFYRIWATPIIAPSGTGMIPAGWFTMGDSLDGMTDAYPISIYVSQFYMETNLVTYGLWQTVYTYATNLGYLFDYPGSGKATNHPVQMVNWYDCVKWCNARSTKEGLTPCYYTNAGLSVVYTSGQVAPYVDWGANGYRLPTEAEWEKAARGGLSGQRFPWGDTISQAQANYYSYVGVYSYDLGPYLGYNRDFNNGGTPYTSPVGYFGPNGYGLNDMAGNVWQYCWDWYGGYGTPTTSNPTGPETHLGTWRVGRGGSWNGLAYNARTAFRNSALPYAASAGGGLRCVRRF